MSNQNQRKIGTGESIAFAGKYKDESCTEGGRDILQSMTDTIKYTGLEAGKTYTIKGWRYLCGYRSFPVPFHDNCL